MTIKLILPAKEVIINFLLRLIGINNQIIKIINFDVENIVSHLEGILVFGDPYLNSTHLFRVQIEIIKI